VKTLEGLGAKHVINYAAEGWKDLLKTKCDTLNVTLAFDAVGGSLTGDLIHAMPTGSEVRVYGNLSGQSGISNIVPSDLIFSKKSVRGFWLTAYMDEKSTFHKIGMTKTVASRLKTSLGTEIRISYPIEKAAEAIQDYNKNPNAKVAFKPPMLPTQ